MPESLYRNRQKQNEKERIGSLKSKISNVHNLITQTRQMIEPKFSSVELNPNDIFESIHINNYTSAKLKIDIILSEQQQTPSILIQQNIKSNIKSYHPNSEEHSTYQSNITKQNFQKQNSRSFEEISKRWLLESQKQKNISHLPHKRQLKQKTFKKISTITEKSSFQPESVNQSETNEDFLLDSNLNNQKYDIKQNIELSQSKQQEKQNQQKLIQENSMIKVLEQLDISAENACQSNFISQNIQMSEQNESYAESSIKQQNIHEIKSNNQTEENYNQTTDLDFGSIDAQNLNFSNASKTYFSLAESKQTQEFNNFKQQLVNSEKTSKQQTTQKLTAQKKNPVKKLLFIQTQQNEDHQNYTYQQSQHNTNYIHSIIASQVKTPQAVKQEKKDKLELSTKQKQAKVDVVQYNLTKQADQHRIRLPEHKRLKKYGQLQKYRRIRSKSQQDYSSPKKQLVTSKIVKINLLDKKAQDLFTQHKQRFLLKLKKNEKKYYANQFHLNRSTNNSSYQNLNTSLNTKRKLSPQCQQITNRLYNSRIGTFPCKFYQKFHQSVERERFQEMIKEYPTATKYLSQKERSDFYLALKKHNIPQTQWMSRLAQFTAGKIKFYLKKK